MKSLMMETGTVFEKLYYNAILTRLIAQEHFIASGATKASNLTYSNVHCSPKPDRTAGGVVFSTR
jgi:hypothetical protein